MVAIAQKTLSFEEFLNWDDKSGRSFELVNGVALPLSEPTAKHEDVVDGLCRLLVDHCQSLNLPYIPRQSKQVRLNAAPGESESSRKADIVVFAKEEWVKMRQSSASAAAYIPPPLAIEVVSTNWRDDYRIKLNEYETLGILEYWIVDYAGLGGVQYIGSPKQSTVTINRLIDGEYQALRYQGEATIVSPTFPQLVLTIAQIIAMTEV
ncbi:MAG: Uma2 family endonuclease [Microcoleus sp. PH2017_25_DOB_D_A]|uniref:Uma2 family endonuclease n=1 Tax=unclassified Microcoleus TaxID=2642155 RepID=UPI001DDFDB26|nr:MULTISPECIES: Uma2 family endonuclease [unclassified Microcoleus]TAE45767.1 MAG: Uma2 family endonuclease [Oscillatoriales cyanobacterium]MCC3494871.1 Uma2 family endonuclease [Microcoleus sp. PH2017_16_JOR_D_A]MCC3538575.1 Uma2 family endonuclease [Microcoleus sp. PH2017_25_DOB_D_A]MCC3550970.1 Uma2 family endonuclease [Microcoleus sp. PH2017_24_DOB_U_A]MCC3568922.1 Uma2 family endonuclease [Microcoleus sp. PH2017_31_RDM_U_A]